MIVKIGDKAVLNCEVADSPDKQWMGLRARIHLGENDGMLFPVGDDFSDMTMVGMSFPIDMLFVGETSTVDGFFCDVQPGVGSIPTRGAKAVIEVQSGFCSRNRIVPGDKVLVMSE
jgi:uncharacterized membrane protein (UPF0127 family)